MISDKTITFYNNPKNMYAESTVNVDMSEAYSHFLKYLPAAAAIMDLGSGSGRDSLYFLKRGFKVVPIDGSQKMCEKTAKLIGFKAQNVTFQKLNYENCFDGVWACASLLHVSILELPDVLNRIARALKTNGVLYASWKYGDSEHVDTVSGRFFCDMNEERINNMFNRTPLFDLKEIWLSADVREEYKTQVWINIIARKKAVNKAPLSKY